MTDDASNACSMRASMLSARSSPAAPATVHAASCARMISEALLAANRLAAPPRPPGMALHEEDAAAAVDATVEAQFWRLDGGGAATATGSSAPAVGGIAAGTRP